MTAIHPGLPPDRPPAHSALFFDFDGTLVDLALTPDAIHVPPDLVRCLRQLQQALQGAVAVVSGRPLAQIDQHLQPLSLCVAGVHGAEWRAADGQVQRCAAPDLAVATASLQRLCRSHPRLHLESKPGALALHFRQAPELEDACAAAMAHALALSPGTALLHGKMVIELRPQGVGKGLAVNRFLEAPPFQHRQPWFFGDDVTDEAAFEVVQQRGGVAVKIGSGDSLAAHRLPDPSALRLWLADAAAQPRQPRTDDPNAWAERGAVR